MSDKKILNVSKEHYLIIKGNRVHQSNTTIHTTVNEIIRECESKCRQSGCSWDFIIKPTAIEFISLPDNEVIIYNVLNEVI